MTDAISPSAAAGALRLLLANLPDPDLADINPPSADPQPGGPPFKRPAARFAEMSSQRDAAVVLGLPANVFIDGDIDGNTVIVEPSDRHIELVVALRGKGNMVIVRRDCALDAVLFAGDGAHIEIGEQTSMFGVDIAAREGARCDIGARCLLANHIRIRPSDVHKIFDDGTGDRINPPRPIVIEDDVWIREYVHIGKGTIVGTGSVVGAASLLDGDYPGNAIIAGTPAKVIRTGIKWKP